MAADQEFVYRLHFSSRDRLEAAFALVSDAPEVASCIVEPDPMHLFFLTSPAVAEPLIERIYSDGGMHWCTRHTIREFR